MDEPKKVFLVCECGDLAHLAVFSYWKDEQQFFISFRLNPDKGFWRRLWQGIKYTFGHKSRYGEFDEIIVTPNDYGKLINLLIDAENDYCKK